MSVLYADPSALLRAYLSDEPEHEHIRELLFAASQRVVTCEVSRVEHASAIHAAARGGRISDPATFLDRFDLESGDEGKVTLLALRPEPILRVAHQLVSAHRLRALDAIHLAVALDHRDAVPGTGDLVFVTRDADQAAAASALGLTVR